MATVKMYSMDGCMECVRLRQILGEKGITVEEIKVSGDDASRAEIAAKTGGAKSIPQLFYGDEYIGGFHAVVGMNATGELDKKLGLQ